MRTSKKGSDWSQLWKRNAVVAAIALFVCAAVYLNWRYAGNVTGDAAPAGTQTLAGSQASGGGQDGGTETEDGKADGGSTKVLGDAALVGGVCEAALGFFIKPLRKFFPPVVTGTVVLAIGLSLIGVGVNSFAGGSGAKDFGSLPNLLLGLLVLIVIVALKHFTKGITSTSCILCGIIVGISRPA